MRMRAAAMIAILLSACSEEPRQATVDPPPVQFQRVSADRIVHGERVANVLGCAGCHGADLTGKDWSEPGFGRLWTANLTRSVPRYRDDQLDAIIRSGARPDRELWEMPSHLFTHITSDDMKALIAFLRTRTPTGDVHPDPVFEEGARQEIAEGTFTSSRAQVEAHGKRWPPEVGRGHELGRYVVRATCAECHGLDLRGGQPHAGAKPRPDLRMVGAYERDDFRRLLSSGKASGNRELTLMSTVARGRYKHLTEGEVDAIYAYLQKVAEAAP